jgi:nifR3 family TIM-barrel protein
MISGFWQKLKKPIFVLAPMANVTDCAFRQIIAKYGKPDIMWTEFVSCDGLCSEGRENILIDLKYSEIERPIVAQIFGAKPENFYKTALLLQELGFDGIDINMGCPDKSVSGKQGSGAALIQEPKLAQKIILETKRGAGKLPVSVKTRLGFNKNTLDTWLPNLLETEPVAITIHARTKKEMSKVPARWDQITKAVEIRDAYDSSSQKTLILGNGDVQDLSDAQKKVDETGCDGVMIGRGIFGNPWLFNRERDYKTISVEEKLRVMVEHTKLFETLLGEHKSFMIMKKHYKAYVNGFEGAKELRVMLMEAHDANEVERLSKEFLSRLKAY